MGEGIAKKILELWMICCGKKKRNCFSTQVENELSCLNPGSNTKKLVYEFYVKKIAFCLLIAGTGVGLLILYICSSVTDTVIEEGGYLERDELGGMERTVVLDAQIGEITISDVMIPVTEKQLSTEETEAASVLKISPDADFSSFKAQELAKLSFSLIPGGIYVLTVALVIFACTTILGWFCYGQQAIYYLGGKKAMNVYRLLFVVMIFFGAVAKLDLVWNFSDIANGLMAIPNIICLFALCGIVVKETDRYLKKGSIDDFAED